MTAYHFTIHDDGTGVEDLGTMSLEDDNQARAFAARVIADLMHRAPTEYSRRTLDITEGKRAVGSIIFAGIAHARQ